MAKINFLLYTIPMASWSQKKQSLYGILAVFLIGLIVGVTVYYKYFNQKETCFDGLKNQNEVNVDCGGVCAKVCTEEVKDLLVQYERFFLAAPQTYSLLASVENLNQGIYAKEMRYVFKTYDRDGVTLDERYAKSYVAPNTTFPITEYGVYLGERIPTKTTISFLGPIDWQRGSFDEPQISVINIRLNGENEKPSAEASIKNNEVYEIRNIKVIVVVYDVLNNVIGTSSTLVERLGAKSSQSISFTWNKAFDTTPSRVDMFPRVLPRDLR